MKKNKPHFLLIFLTFAVYSFNSQAQQFTQEELQQFNQINNAATQSEINNHNNSIDQAELDRHTRGLDPSIKRQIEIDGKNSECDLDDDEELVCKVLMCVIGITIPESMDECIQVGIDYAEYKIALGPFKSPPSCRSRNESCERGDKADDEGVEIQCRQLGLGNDRCEWLDEK